MSVDIVTFARYEDVFSDSKKSLHKAFEEDISKFDPIESICFSSFLNMVCQTTPIRELIQLQTLGKGGLIPPDKLANAQRNNLLVYSRENLLIYIGKFIETNIDGTEVITGTELGNSNMESYVKCLLSISDEIDTLSAHSSFWLERYLIRDYPPKDSDTIWNIYKNRILRYKCLFTSHLKVLEDKDALFWIELKNQFKESVGFTLDKYINVIKKIFIWFATPDRYGVEHFNMDNINTFYIRSEFFQKDPDYIEVLNSLSKDRKGFEEYFKKKRKDSISSHYKYLQAFYDFPVFKIKKGEYCIIDLSYFLENATSGLFWKLHSIKTSSLQDFSGKYGLLIESYFKYLVTSIFGKNIDVTEGRNLPDGLLHVFLDNQEYVFVMEFTIKSYRIASLFNASIQGFDEDIDQKLFDPHKQDSQVKFKQLNKFVRNTQNKFPKARVIPLLVTESWIGDYDLINRNDNCLDKAITNNKLQFLENEKPIFLSLDDLEYFWAGTLPENATEVFAEDLLNWQLADKGKYLFNFTNYISDQNRRYINDDYLSVFGKDSLFKD